jgi:hypothetical protein
MGVHIDCITCWAGDTTPGEESIFLRGFLCLLLYYSIFCAFLVLFYSFAFFVLLFADADLASRCNKNLSVHTSVLGWEVKDNAN